MNLTSSNPMFFRQGRRAKYRCPDCQCERVFFSPLVNILYCAIDGCEWRVYVETQRPAGLHQLHRFYFVNIDRFLVALAQNARPAA